jgi:DNA adenine methylase
LSFVKWAGGKRQLLDQLIKYVPKDIEDYCEPFVGGGALFFKLRPRHAVLNDLNYDLINAYEVVRDCCEELIERLREHQVKHSTDYYYTIRGTKYTDLIDAAARFIYLNKTCFNGLYRVNKKGEFNVPIGSYKNPVICDADRLRSCSADLRGAILCNGEFDADCLCGASFVYFDPPYVPVKSTSHTEYCSDGFGYADQVRLRDCVDRLSDRGVRVLLSNSDTDVVYDLYAGYRIDRVQARRAINSNGSGRGSVYEVLVRNYEI